VRRENAGYALTRRALNDLDDGVTNFFRVLQDPDKSNELHRKLLVTPYSEREFLDARKTWKTCEDAVEKARLWFINIRQSWGGLLKGGFGYMKSPKKTKSSSVVQPWLSAIDRLPLCSERLRRCQIFNRDFREIISLFDTSNTFFYLDPPYVHSTRKTKSDYQHEMTEDDHIELVERLLELKGKAMLSGYANPIYGALECAGWERVDIDWQTKMSKKDTKRIETLWIKYW